MSIFPFFLLIKQHFQIYRKSSFVLSNMFIKLVQPLTALDTFQKEKALELFKSTIFSNSLKNTDISNNPFQGMNPDTLEPVSFQN